MGRKGSLYYCLCGHVKDVHDDEGCCSFGCYCRQFILTSHDEDYEL